MKRTVFVVRGVAGSGKSFKAQQIQQTAEDQGLTSVSLSADENIYRGGFAPHKVAPAYAHCLVECMSALQQDIDVVVVHNTFACMWEYEAYKKLAELCRYDFRVVTMPCNSVEECKAFSERSSRSVPLHSTVNTFLRFESDPAETHF